MAYAAIGLGTLGSTVSQAGTLEVVAASGDTVPGSTDVLTLFGIPSVNNAGQVAFVAGRAPGVGSALTGGGVFRNDGSQTTLVLSIGDTLDNGLVVDDVIGVDVALLESGTVMAKALVNAGAPDQGNVNVLADGIRTPTAVLWGGASPDGGATRCF